VLSDRSNVTVLRGASTAWPSLFLGQSGVQLLCPSKSSGGVSVVVCRVVVESEVEFCGLRSLSNACPRSVVCVLLLTLHIAFAGLECCFRAIDSTFSSVSWGMGSGLQELWRGVSSSGRFRGVDLLFDWCRTRFLDLG